MKIQNFRVTDDVVYVNDVPYYREAVDLTKAKKVLEKWEWFKSYIEDELTDTQTAYDDLKKNGLSFNAIEAEGFLRAIKTIHAQLQHIDEVIDR